MDIEIFFPGRDCATVVFMKQQLTIIVDKFIH